GRTLPRGAVGERRCSVRFFAIARHPDAQDGSLRTAGVSEDHGRHRARDGEGGGHSRRVHGRTMSDGLFDRVALIGIGLIGSSLARVLRRDSPDTTIVACARRAETLATVRRLALADETTDDPAQAAEGADLVIVATPLSAYAAIGERIAPVLKEGAILTDVGSVKQAGSRD